MFVSSDILYFPTNITTLDCIRDDKNYVELCCILLVFL